MAAMIEAQVAEIIDSRTLVLNRGEDAGIEVGMRFRILNRKGSKIVDPVTKEELGSVAVEKVEVKVIEVQPRLSVAMTYRVIPGRPGIFAALEATSQISGTPSKTETLKTDGKTLKAELSESDSIVKIGDPAVQTVT